MLWLLVAAVVVGAAGRSAARRRALLARLPPRDDPRWTGERSKQIAGRACATCRVRLVAEAEGTACDQCEEVVHSQHCLARHLLTVHRPDAEPPYR